MAEEQPAETAPPVEVKTDAGPPPSSAGGKSAKGNKKKLKAQQDEQARADAKAAEENRRAEERENQRWRDCLECLRETVPKLRENPWLIVLEPNHIHDYLDSLTETLASLSKHEGDLEQVRRVLQDVYEGFVDLGKFSKYQPSFFISHPPTVFRFVRLLEQVAHRGSDRALFPNVLCLLGPTFDRPELYDLLADAHIVTSLMSFVRTSWKPTAATLKLLLIIFKKLSVSARMRLLFMEDPGFEKLQQLADGILPKGYPEAFTSDQQILAKQALELFPPMDSKDIDDGSVPASPTAG